MRKAIGIGAAAVVAAGVIVGGVASADGNDGYSKYVKDGKITVCHATGLAAQPWLPLTVKVGNVTSTGVLGHGSHTQDVVPPIYAAGVTPDGSRNFFDGFGNPKWYAGAKVTPESCNPVPGSGTLIPYPTVAAGQPQPKFRILKYNYTPGVGTVRNFDPDGTGPLPSRRGAHLAHARAAKEAGNLANIGAAGSRDNPLAPGTKEGTTAYIVFRDVDDSVITAYAESDPYQGTSADPTDQANFDLIESYEIIPWTVVG